jgi:hypothetical protein
MTMVATECSKKACAARVAEIEGQMGQNAPLDSRAGLRRRPARLTSASSSIGTVSVALRSVFLAIAVGFAGAATADEDKLVHVVRFTDYEIGTIDDWLLGKGFRFEQDAKRRDRIDFDIEDNALLIESNKRALGLMPNEAVNLQEFDYIEIDWGVNRHPRGASYEQGVRNEAIMAIVFLGDERHPSGSMFIPDSPYFVGLFLCSGDDRVNHPYVGSYFKKNGRYVCLDRPGPGQLVRSRFDLLQAYRRFFDKEGDDDPGISGIALGLDTKKSKGGKASAFVREIRLYR